MMHISEIEICLEENITKEQIEEIEKCVIEILQKGRSYRNDESIKRKKTEIESSKIVNTFNAETINMHLQRLEIIRQQKRKEIKRLRKEIDKINGKIDYYNYNYTQQAEMEIQPELLTEII